MKEKLIEILQLYTGLETDDIDALGKTYNDLHKDTPFRYENGVFYNKDLFAYDAKYDFLHIHEGADVECIKELPYGLDNASGLFAGLKLPSDIASLDIDVLEDNDFIFNKCLAQEFYPDNLPRTKYAKYLFNEFGENQYYIVVYTFQSRKPLHTEEDGTIERHMYRARIKDIDKHVSYPLYTFPCTCEMSGYNVMHQSSTEALQCIYKLSGSFFSWFGFSNYSTDLRVYILKVPISKIARLGYTDYNANSCLFNPSYNGCVNFIANAQSIRVEAVIEDASVDDIIGAADITVTTDKFSGVTDLNPIYSFDYYDSVNGVYRRKKLEIGW